MPKKEVCITDSNFGKNWKTIKHPTELAAIDKIEDQLDILRGMNGIGMEIINIDRMCKRMREELRPKPQEFWLISCCRDQRKFVEVKDFHCAHVANGSCCRVKLREVVDE